MEVHDHVVPIRTYVSVLAALMFLVVLTVAAACIDLNRLLHAPFWNLTVAMLIAVTKAILIILFFMHVKYSSRLVWAFATAAFVWLGIMMTLSLSDYLTRDYPEGSPTSAPQSGSQVIRPPPRPDAVVPGAD